MLKAYHYVAGGIRGLETIQADGFISPASWRLGKKQAEGLCRRWRKDWAFNCNPEIAKALEGLYKERLRSVRKRRHETEASTMLKCLDLLAGDWDRVFFSLNAWPKELLSVWRKEGSYENGLVFDAGQLIQAGASVRSADLYQGYAVLHDNLCSWGPASPEEAREAVRNSFEDIVTSNEYRGDEALGWLDRLGDDAEIVFSGVVPTEWAIEVWRNGYRVA